jgi:outer membrane protein assembly complex protein YaeT
MISILLPFLFWFTPQPCFALSSPASPASPSSAEPISAATNSSHLLKFSGLPASQIGPLRKKFPFINDREPKLYELDEIIRWLMQTGQYSGVEVVKRPTSDGVEMILVASWLRKIQDIRITGNSVLNSDEIIKTLGISKGQVFERKNLLEAAKNLQAVYSDLGYFNARVEIEFELPNENEVRVDAKIFEGQPTKITDVLIDTSNPELTSRLKHLSKRLIKKKLNTAELQDFQRDVTEFLKANRYITARLSDPSTAFNADRTQVKLGFSVENPWKFEILFYGNNYFSTGTLLKSLELDKLGGMVSSPAADLADKIRRYYQTAGFSNAEVTFDEKLFEDSHRQQINFKVSEGPRVYIKHVEVSGNISKSPNYYAQFIKSSSSDLIGAGFYNRKDIEDGTRNLIIELQNQGFMHARLQSQKVEYSKDKSNVTIFLNIDEGVLTQIREIRFEGLSAVSKTTLSDLMAIKAGSGLNLRDLEESIQRLKDYYFSHGYLEMRILNENEKNRIVTYNDTNTQAIVEFQVYEGPRVIVDTTVLRGNHLTKDNVILRELDFKKGEILTPEKIENSVFKLQKLGIFSHVNIKTAEDGSAISERTVVIEVDERDPGLFTMGLGAATEREGFLRLRGYLGIAYRNILGTGRAISLRADPSYSSDPRISYIENRITLSYLEPYIFGDSNRGRMNLIREQAFYDLENNRALIQEANTVNFLIERDLTRKIKLTHTAYSFSNQRKFFRDNHDVKDSQKIGKLGPLVEFDFRDDIFNPSKGSYSFIAAEFADPILGSTDDSSQTIEFLKTYASVTHYQSFKNHRNFVWANSIRGGYLKNLSGKSNAGIPSQEAFFLGGRTTIRGFDAGDLERIPNNIDLGVGNLRDFRVTNESAYFLVKTEMRVPIWRNSPIGDVGGAVFYDGGSVMIWQPGVVQPDPYRDSAGVGLRIGTPVGPVNLEIGWKLDRRILRSATAYSSEIRESPWAFHFSIGTF